MNYLSTLVTPTTQTTTKVILVRHARTTYNEQGRYQGSNDESVLTETGRQTAYQTGLALQQYNFDAIYTSPLTRVKQTSYAIISALKEKTDNLPPILIEPKLTEIHMSDWQGLYYQEVQEKFPEAYRCWQETPHLFSCAPLGKGTPNRLFFPVVELFKQAEQFWQEVLNKHRGKTILVVAHSGTNRALISTAIGLNPEHYHSLQQSNCGISCLEFSSINSNRGKLNYLNDTSHLGKKMPKLKAGKTGWRWLLLSDKLTSNFIESSWLSESIEENLIDLLLTDDSQKSELLALNLLKKSKQIIHLPLAQDRFIKNWQQTIFARQTLNYDSVDANLVTGLIIVSENLLCQILQKILGNTVNLETADRLSIIHYPQGDRQSILQGLLPIERQLVTQLS